MGNNRTEASVANVKPLADPACCCAGSALPLPKPTFISPSRDYRVSLSEFKQRVIGSVADVEEAYQNLVPAPQMWEVPERLVVATEQTYRIVKEREKIDATKASIAQALQAVWTRRADLLGAQSAHALPRQTGQIVDE